jgi:hypothetical protein
MRFARFRSVTVMDLQVLLLLLSLLILGCAPVVWITARWRLAGRRAARDVKASLAPASDGVAPRQLGLQSLRADEGVRLSYAWRLLQLRFLEEPRQALAEADRLLGEVLSARGFPLGEMESYSDAIDATCPGFMNHYRLARGVALRQRKRHVGADDVQEAFVAYGTMFEDLLDPLGGPAGSRGSAGSTGWRL